MSGVSYRQNCFSETQNYGNQKPFPLRYSQGDRSLATSVAGCFDFEGGLSIYSV